MAVKKIYSNYHDEELRQIYGLQIQIDTLSSYNNDYYIVQRDEFNEQQKYKWKIAKANFQKYSDKYYDTTKINWSDPKSERELILAYYCDYEIHEITGYGPFSKVDITFYLNNTNVPVDPSDIKLPDEPIPITDLKMFKEPIEQKIRELEHERDSLKAELDKNMHLSEKSPLYLDDRSGRWLYQDAVYEVTGGHSDDEKKLLILEFSDKELRRFERLKNKFSGKKSDEVKYERVRIPEEVRIAVWRRDQGRCARCGSRENLEYDHIVPVSKGGGNTERNIELLCQDCNRSKGNRIE